MSEEFFKPEHLLALPAYFLILLTAIFLHEMGHYLAARIFGIPIKSATIGQGRLLKSWYNKRGVQWRLKLLPLGAHVHLQNMQARSFIQKIITILAGPLINFAIVPILFFAFYCAFGQPSAPNIVVGVEQGLVGDRAGLEVGDQITAVNGIALNNNRDMWNIAYKLGASQNTYTIKRGQQVFDLQIKPDWIEYEDLRGVPRKNARFGIIWQHAPYKLKDIIKVNGIDTNNDINRTRKLLIEHFDQDITINIKAPLDEDIPSRISLRGDINEGLLDEDSDFYKAVYLGQSDGNIYQRDNVSANLVKAWSYSRTLFLNIAKVPFQIFPIDKAMLKDSASVSSKDTKIINGLYALMHLFAVASIAIGLINLLPFPNLDGGQLVDQCLKHIRGNALTNKFRANVFAVLFLILYAAIFISNMDNLHGYVDSRLKKVHQFIDQEIMKTDNSAKKSQKNLATSEEK